MKYRDIYRVFLNGLRNNVYVYIYVGLILNESVGFKYDYVMWNCKMILIISEINYYCFMIFKYFC